MFLYSSLLRFFLCMLLVYHRFWPFLCQYIAQLAYQKKKNVNIGKKKEDGSWEKLGKDMKWECRRQ